MNEVKYPEDQSLYKQCSLGLAVVLVLCFFAEITQSNISCDHFSLNTISVSYFPTQEPFEPPH